MVAPAMLTPKEAAAYLAVSLRTLYTMLAKDAGLRACRAHLSGSVARFNVAKLDRWARRQTAKVAR